MRRQPRPTFLHRDFVCKNRREACTIFVFGCKMHPEFKIALPMHVLKRFFSKKIAKMLNDRYCIFLKTADTKMMHETHQKSSIVKAKNF